MRVEQEQRCEHGDDKAAELQNDAQRRAAGDLVKPVIAREEEQDILHRAHARSGQQEGEIKPAVAADAVRGKADIQRFHSAFPPAASSVSVSLMRR